MEDSENSESAKILLHIQKKILQLGEIVFWIEHSIVLVFAFSVFFEGVLFFLFPNRMSFLKLIIIEDEMERIVMREDAEKHCGPWRMTRFSSVFFLGGLSPVFRWLSFIATATQFKTLCLLMTDI